MAESEDFAEELPDTFTSVAPLRAALMEVLFIFALRNVANYTFFLSKPYSVHYLSP